MGRGVKVGGGNSGIIQTGDANTAIQGHGNTVANSHQLPDPASVDMAAVLRDLRAALEPLAGTYQGKVTTRLDEAEAELAKPTPDKDEIATSLDQALDYANKAGALATKVETILPMLTKAAGWLGRSWKWVQAFFPDAAAGADGIGLIGSPEDGPTSV